MGGAGVGSSGGGINGTNYGDGGSGNGGIGKEGIIIIKVDINSTNLLNIKSDNINFNNLVISCNLAIGGTIFRADGSVFSLDNSGTSGGSSSSSDSKWSVSTGTSNIYYDGGLVGIGFNNPQAILHLSSPNANSEIVLKMTDGGTGIGAILSWLTNGKNVWYGRRKGREWRFPQCARERISWSI